VTVEDAVPEIGMLANPTKPLKNVGTDVEYVKVAVYVVAVLDVLFEMFTLGVADTGRVVVFAAKVLTATLCILPLE
jgi:hypothetical protein